MMSADEGEGNAKVNSICNDDVETAPFLAVDGSEALRSRRRVNQIGEQSLMRFANRKHLMPQHHHSATQPSTGYTTIGRAASIDDGFDDVDTGEYYYDDTNDQSWTCSFGTKEDDGIWMVRSDPPGTMMSIIVWILIGTCILLQLSFANHPRSMLHFDYHSSTSVFGHHYDTLIRIRTSISHPCRRVLHDLCIGTCISCKDNVYRSRKRSTMCSARAFSNSTDGNSYNVQVGVHRNNPFQTVARLF